MSIDVHGNHHSPAGSAGGGRFSAKGRRRPASTLTDTSGPVLDADAEWAAAGFVAEQADRWRAAGFTAAEADDWVSGGFTVDDASGADRRVDGSDRADLSDQGSWDAEDEEDPRIERAIEARADREDADIDRALARYERRVYGD